MNRKGTERKRNKYVPGKQYQWDPEEKFTITGREIDNINKALQAATSSPEFQKYVTIYNGILSFQKFFEEAVEDGLITELTEEAPQVKGDIVTDIEAE